VDHHELIMLKTDTVNETFTILDANDGGLGVSYDNGVTWQQITNGYNTTQFYGVSKKPGENIYVGGMQDNGTWITKAVNPEAQDFEFMLEGDGFEAIWHPNRPGWVIGSTYNNNMSVSINGGESWTLTNDGINNDGPFVTRIAYSDKNPDNLFVAGNRGVYRHDNFGVGKFPWYLTEITDSAWTLSLNTSSQHLVTVSKANKNIVWAGEGINHDPELRVFLSKDGGETFKKTAPFPEVEEMGFLTNIATHPVNENTAYALFSISEKPKILRTNDFGESWEDISGFYTNDTSSNGFPDVMVFCLYVMPDDTNTIWVGTELGIMESTDNGETWFKSATNLPAVSVWQIQQIDNQLVVATHGRGIFTADYAPLDIRQPIDRNQSTMVYPNPADDERYITNVNTSGRVVLKLYSNNGALVKTQSFNVKNHNKIHWHIGGVNPGNYLLQIYGDNLIETHNIVVQ